MNNTNLANERKRNIDFLDGWTVDTTTFSHMCEQASYRIGIVSEGDSWFAYPGDVRPWSLNNVIDHIVNQLIRRDVVNLLRLETNGATAEDMLSDEGKKPLESVLEKNGNYIHLILFSGGSNDILKKTTLGNILNNHDEKFTKASDYVNSAELDKSLKAVCTAYRNLLGLCNTHTPNAKIVTHVYDIPKPRDEPYVVVPVALEKGPWIHPVITKHQIPEKMHIPIARYLLKRFQECLTSIVDDSRGRLFVADTQCTLSPGDENDWQDEIHPSSNGFRRIARIFYRQMMAAQSGLPEWRD